MKFTDEQIAIIGENIIKALKTVFRSRNSCRYLRIGIGL